MVERVEKVEEVEATTSDIHTFTRKPHTQTHSCGSLNLLNLLNFYKYSARTK
ncbi:hypothetical protein Halhy_4125 [Haliscomenobacter hydrossis DSM 1100]|uniref:Uncharacterized protein n=1 Tax=Haliscomenobacter hydrossis (strain ATCC 27775 / DSM 1100 / LMG 10767 / O) TaxID=760192 RepID=F4L4H0_HALH1|nr:hypothetical protein Halhy_4125 [Haliscomenobacter hydrossis DSM 1100]